jgi:hypothetical protein
VVASLSLLLPCRPHWPPCFSLSHRSWAFFLSCLHNHPQARQQPRRETQGLQACSFIPRGKRCHFPPFPSFYFCFVFAVRGLGTHPFGLLNSAPLSSCDCFGKFSCLFSVACFGILRLGMVCQQGCARRLCLFRPEGFREARQEMCSFVAINFQVFSCQM